VAAELTNNASDAVDLPVMLEAVRTNLQALPEQVLADTGYRSEAVFEALAESGCDVVVALGREGKGQAALDPEKLPYTAAMAAKLDPDRAPRQSARQGLPPRLLGVSAPSCLRRPPARCR